MPDTPARRDRWMPALPFMPYTRWLESVAAAASMNMLLLSLAPVLWAPPLTIMALMSPGTGRRS